MIKKQFKILYFLMIFIVQIGFAQEKIVTGSVTDENGVPLSGVNILIQGTTQGTNTDFDGKYSIAVSQGQTLQFSSVGFEDQTVTVGSSDVIDVSMREGSALDEVFVVAYGTATRESYTGAADVVRSENLVVAQNASFQDALMGQAPGVNITKGSGVAGAATNIQIRGVGSINASTEPLYVIDGVPISNDESSQIGDYLYSSNNIMNSLNPEDIESISILKDAAASSLYGSRAANGVVVITTKKGKHGEPKVTIKSSVGFSPSWATKNWEPASTQDNIDYLYRVYYDAELSSGGTADESRDYAVQSLRNRFSKYGYDFNTSGNGPGERVDVTPLTDGVLQRDGFYDWSKTYFRNAINQTNDISVSGGTDKTTYYSSLSYSRNDGRIKINDFDRYSGRVNLTQKIGDHIEFGSNVSVSKTNLTVFNDTDNAGQNYFQSVQSRLFGVYWPTDYKTGETWTADYGFSGGQNWMHYDDLWDNTSKIYQTRAINRLKVDILPELSAQTIFSYDNSETKDHLYYSREHYLGENLGKVHEMSTNERRLVSSTTVNYNQTFDNVHNVDFLVGYEAEKNTANFQRASGTDLPASNLHTVATAGEKDASGYSWGNSMVSYLSKLEYNFDRKYYVSGSFRRDGSSKLGPDTRWGNFWSVSGAWSIDKEEFMKQADFINSLRLRASYGVNGTLPPSNYGWRSLIGYSSNYMSKPGGRLTNIADANLSWETNYATDIALEFGLFDNRLYGTIEYFNRDSKDLLQEVAISRVTGFSKTLKNIGSINNRGIEFQIGGTLIENQDFSWTANVNGSFIKSKVTKLNEGADIIWNDNIDERAQYIYREGESTLAFYGYEYAGVDKSNGVNMFYVNDPDDPTAGDFLLDGRGATYDYEKANYKIIGDAFPDLAGGINTEAKYKGVSLGLNFIYKIGGYIYDGVDWMVADDGLYWERMRAQYAVDNMWTEENPNGSLPKVRGTDEEGVTQYSTRHMYDASFLRLKNIRLGYDFPSKFINDLGLSSLRVYATGSNLLTFSKYKHADPEVNRFSTKGWEIPFSKNYTFGIELSF